MTASLRSMLVPAMFLVVGVPRPGVTGPAPQSAGQVETLLRQMREAYGGIRMARVRFVEERIADGFAPSDGVVEYAGRRRLRAHLVLDGVELMTVRTDGSRIVMESRHLEGLDVRPFSPRALNRALTGSLEIAALYDWQRQLSTSQDGLLHGATLRVRHGVQWGGRGRNSIRWTVLEEDTPVAVFRYFVHPETHLIWRTERIDRRTGELVYASTVEQLEVVAG